MVKRDQIFQNEKDNHYTEDNGIRILVKYCTAHVGSTCIRPKLAQHFKSATPNARVKRVTSTIVQSKKPISKHASHRHLLKMALLVDKHRPRSLDALSYHPELSDRLKALVMLPARARILQELQMLTVLIIRLRVETSHIYSFMALPALARRRGSRRR